MKAILSIKPKYVNEIINGNKKYEFRKSVFKNKVDGVFIYASAPVSRIVGYFIYEEIIEGHPRNLWKQFKNNSGIDKSSFFEYFSGKERGFAIKIKKLKVFKKPVNPFNRIPNFVPPQSFSYMREEYL